MKAIGVTHKGIEDVAALEIKELINKPSKVEDSVVLFEANKQDLALLCYKSQSLIKVLELFFKLKINKLEDFEKIGKVDFKGSFAVRCLRIGEHDFSSKDIEKVVGGAIYEKTKQKVNLENPDVTIFVYLYNDKAYIGIDYAGIDLSKRDYKIFTGAKALKGTIAYSLVRLSGYKPNEVLLDPFSISGEVPIEAALFASKFPLNFFDKEKFTFKKFLKFNFEKEDKNTKKSKLNILCYDSQLRNVKAAQKNAKIAGIDKQIRFGRADIEWLDTKFDKESIDKIVTRIPELARFQKEKDIEKLYKEFFYQVEFILKKKGRIVVIARDLSLFKKYVEKFEVKNEREVSIGKEVLKIAVLEK